MAICSHIVIKSLIVSPIDGICLRTLQFLHRFQHRSNPFLERNIVKRTHALPRNIVGNRVDMVIVSTFRRTPSISTILTNIIKVGSLASIVEIDRIATSIRIECVVILLEWQRILNGIRTILMKLVEVAFRSILTQTCKAETDRIDSIEHTFLTLPVDAIGDVYP